MTCILVFASKDWTVAGQIVALAGFAQVGASPVPPFNFPLITAQTGKLSLY